MRDYYFVSSFVESFLLNSFLRSSFFVLRSPPSLPQIQASKQRHIDWSVNLSDDEEEPDESSDDDGAAFGDGFDDNDDDDDDDDDRFSGGLGSGSAGQRGSGHSGAASAEAGGGGGGGGGAGPSLSPPPLPPLSSPSSSSSSPPPPQLSPLAPGKSLVAGVAAGAGARGAFEQAVADIVVTGWAKKDPVEALLMEVNCYKLAQNKQFEDCLTGAAAALIAIAAADADTKRGVGSSDGEAWSTADVGRFLTALKAQLAYWAPLLAKLTQREEANEEALVAAVERRLLDAANPSQAHQFPRILQMLYGDGESGVVSEEGILRWATTKREEGGGEEEMALFKMKGTQDFLEWLEDEDDDDDDDDDDE